MALSVPARTPCGRPVGPHAAQGWRRRAAEPDGLDQPGGHRVLGNGIKHLGGKAALAKALRHGQARHAMGQAVADIGLRPHAGHRRLDEFGQPRQRRIAAQHQAGAEQCGEGNFRQSPPNQIPTIHAQLPQSGPNLSIWAAHARRAIPGPSHGRR
jgi:hypothetical protein